MIPRSSNRLASPRPPISGFTGAFGNGTSVIP